MKKVAILYQVDSAPSKDGIIKPMKPGGYSDSGADIAFALRYRGLKVITPFDKPQIENDFEWVFPDNKIGITDALNKGANTLWLNTVLYKNHAIEDFFIPGIQFIGQYPSMVDLYDDKFYTNNILKEKGIPIPDSQLINLNNSDLLDLEIDFPLLIKPIRGRGSQGVQLIRNEEELGRVLRLINSHKIFGDAIYVEEYLSGQEITVTIMPAGKYNITNEERDFTSPWCLPAVKRYNHIDGIAPYNGVVAVIENSSALDSNEMNTHEIQEVYAHCQSAAMLLNIRAPIRIDCRANDQGKYFLFDINMKPNMTGPSRPQRIHQDSLTLIAAREIAWNYGDLLINMLNQSWHLEE